MYNDIYAVILAGGSGTRFGGNVKNNSLSFMEKRFGNIFTIL